jgi:hypothetical protein
MIAQSLESGDSNMKQSGEIQAITVNGAAAGSVELQTVSPSRDAEGRPRSERDWLVAVPRTGGNAIMIVFVASQIHFEQMRPAFEKMLRSAQF